MKKVTVNGVDHELSPDSPRSRSHVELLQDMVTSINNLETGTSPDGLELTSTDAAVNVITSASNDATTTASVAALTFKNTVAHATNDLEYNFTRSDDTSLLKIDKEGDVTAAGSVSAPTVNVTGTAGLVVTGSTTTAVTLPAGSRLNWGSTNIEESGTVLTCGTTFSVSGLYARTGDPMLVRGRQADGATAVGVTLDAGTALANAAAKLVSIKNANVEKAYFDKDGGLAVGSHITPAADNTLNLGSATNRFKYIHTDTIRTNASDNRIVLAASGGNTFEDAIGPGGTDAHIFKTAVAFTSPTASIGVFKNGTTAVANVQKDGNYVNLDVAGTAGSGTGISTVRTAQVRHVVHAVTVTEAALTDADTSQAVTIWTVPAKTRILRIVADVTAAFTGGGVTACTLQVGISGGDADAYIVASDVFAGAVTLGDVEADLGVALGNAGTGAGAFANWGGTQALAAQFDTTTANVADLTAGSVTFYIECVSY